MLFEREDVMEFFINFIMKTLERGLESGKIAFLRSEKLPFRALVTCWSINSYNRDLAEIGAEIIGEGDWRKINYGKVLFTYFFDRKKYNDLVKKLKEYY